MPILIVALVIGIIMATTAILPLASDYSEAKTFKNEGLIYATSLNADSAHIFSFDYTNPNKLTIDSVEVDMANLSSPYGSLSVCFSDDWFLRYSPGTGVILYKCGTTSAQAIEGATVSSEKNLTLTIASGAATIEIGTNTYNYEIDGDGLIMTSSPAEYVVKASSDTVFVNEESIIYGVGRTDKALETSGTSFNAILKASIKDGITPLYYSPQYVFSENESMNYTEDSAYKDLYKLTGFTFNLVSQGVDHPVTYDQVFVPSEVTADPDNPDTYKNLIKIVPLMAFIMLVVAAAAMIISKRD